MTDRPKVFHFITRLLKGGAEAKTIATVFGLDDYAFTVGHGRAFDREQITRLEGNGVATECFPLVRHYNPATALPAVASLARYLRREQFDIVHTHSTEAGIIGRFAAVAAGIPHVVHTVHGVPFTEDRNPLLNRFVLGCERKAATYTDRIVTNADVIAEAYLDRGIGTRDQYTTIYSGVELEAFRAATPATDLPGQRPRVVMIGRLAEGKGFEIMLEAAEQICDDDATVLLVGEGPLFDDLDAEITARGLEADVFMTGYRDDVPNVLAASDVLALPSFREGTPRVITEAMASGLPVVATDIAGVPEQVEDGENGYLIPTGDADALAERLSTLLADRQLREKMGDRGRERASRFSVEQMCADIGRLYEGLLDAPPDAG
ncbi:MAG: glycosyltransferase family 4 protein [Halorientalis sp.]